ncbi:5'-nucleotidase [Keratinibaculum paraultunense]|uniref:5'-nucleotidase n=1 Tax=Keratinibaculum paraultunense TaxID=1278232 RepID=A0A4V2UUN8_9FIRM|nr:5'-nucleotidase C-terminal domain-containing protein [Keratinibaculum paraultunense]QQY79959.1 5'-nucleotidase C-terminal domain-containing protein [Keratinibaculum paraultunense]TCS91720.1 5'-nucleotidase [Keratinibaculum paraultunense]
MNFKNKRILSIFLSLALIISILLPVGNKVFAEEAKSTKITIVHTNDVHSRVEGDEKELIGYAKLATKIKELKEENPNVLVLDAGDTIHGLPMATISKGESIIKLMNQIGYDAMVPGNHDFNYGYERLLELKEIAEFPILAANVVREDGTKDLEEYIIKEIDGVKVGIFGLATEETKYKSNPKNTEGINITSPVDTAKEMVNKLKEEKVDIIIALTHIGLDEGSVPKSSDIADKVEGIDIIIDGHSHTVLEEGKMVGNTLIAQAGEHLKNIGIINIDVVDGKIADKKAKLIKFDEVVDLKEDEKISNAIEELKKKNEEVTSVVVGKTKVRLVGEREAVRTGESNLGNLATDAMLDLTGADVAITNGGGIRASIEPGDITKGDILEVFPFGNYIVVKKLKGIDILNALEYGVDTYPEPAGKFPHVAGMTFKIDPSKEAGNRIVDLKIKGKPVDLNKTYTVATNDFMAIGGDGYTMLAEGELVGEFEGLDEALIKYIEKIGEVDYEVEGRITILQTPVEEPDKEVVVPAPKEKEYTVKPGDVLWKIAEKFGTTWQKLAEYNKLKNPHLIFPGQKILIPTN